MLRLALLSPIAAFGLRFADGAKSGTPGQPFPASEGLIVPSAAEIAVLRSTVFGLPAAPRARHRTRRPQRNR